MRSSVKCVAMMVAFVFFLSAMLSTEVLGQADYEWQVGLAKSPITPTTQVWLAGYGTKRPPDGKLHELWMKVIALQDKQGHLAVLVTSDFQGIPKSMSDRVFALCKARYQLNREQIMLTFSHNHCGPRLGDDLVDYYPIEDEQVELVQEYTDRMVAEMVETIGKALKNLQSAYIAQGLGRATFAVNRRNNKEDEVPHRLANQLPLVGPMDHDVPVLRISDSNHRVMAILFGYACHPTTLSFNTWCGDYPGFAQLELEQKHAGCMAMFVNTCGGDQNPLPRRRVELCERYGHMLANGVSEALDHSLQPVAASLKMAFEIVELPYLQTVRRDELQAYLNDGNAIKARWARRLLKSLNEGEQFASSYPYPIHAWRLGQECLLIGMGAETVVDYAIRFKREFGFGTWVLGYTDDMISYIPSRRVWEEGGYEGGSNLYEYGRPALRWSEQIEDRIAESVHRLAHQVQVQISRTAANEPTTASPK
jgi:hypothetical protein